MITFRVRVGVEIGIGVCDRVRVVEPNRVHTIIKIHICRSVVVIEFEL